MTSRQEKIQGAGEVRRKRHVHRSGRRKGTGGGPKPMVAAFSAEPPSVELPIRCADNDEVVVLQG